MKIEVVPYDALWPAQFEEERCAIAGCFGDILERAHHMGSTAVVGLPAKPVIDIMLEVRSLDSLDEATCKLEALGYEEKGEFGIPRRRYFRKGGDDRTHQIHAFKAGDPHVLRHLAFRDYLRAHPDVLREYGRLKMQLAAECHHDLDRYCDGKEAFVKHYEAMAIEWKNAGQGDQPGSCQRDATGERE